MASWIDLPDGVANLRYVPEMIVALLADQDGDEVAPNKEGEKKSWFAVGRGFEDNVLLRAFHQGVIRGDILANPDRFQEDAAVGLDQLLMIRLAQHLGQAPDKLRGKDGDKISNQRAIAELASRDFLRISASSSGVTQRQFLATPLLNCLNRACPWASPRSSRARSKSFSVGRKPER